MTVTPIFSDKVYSKISMWNPIVGGGRTEAARRREIESKDLERKNHNVSWCSGKMENKICTRGGFKLKIDEIDKQGFFFHIDYRTRPFVARVSWPMRVEFQ